MKPPLEPAKLPTREFNSTSNPNLDAPTREFKRDTPHNPLGDSSKPPLQLNTIPTREFNSSPTPNPDTPTTREFKRDPLPQQTDPSSGASGVSTPPREFKREPLRSKESDFIPIQPDVIPVREFAKPNPTGQPVRAPFQRSVTQQPTPGSNDLADQDESLKASREFKRDTELQRKPSVGIPISQESLKSHARDFKRQTGGDETNPGDGSESPKGGITRKISVSSMPKREFKRSQTGSPSPSRQPSKKVLGATSFVKDADKAAKRQQRKSGMFPIPHPSFLLALRHLTCLSCLRRQIPTPGPCESVCVMIPNSRDAPFKNLPRHSP